MLAQGLQVCIKAQPKGPTWALTTMQKYNWGYTNWLSPSAVSFRAMPSACSMIGRAASV